MTLTGTNFDPAASTITIDGVDCPVVTGSSSTTSLVCTVGARSSTYNQANTFTVYVGNSAAIIRDTFLYVLKWSDATTWGVDMPPV